MDEIEELFPDLPKKLRDEFIQTFNKVLKNYTSRNWEPAELNGGKFCEIVYTIIKGYTDGTYPSSPSKPGNMTDACKRFELIPSTYPRSIRIQIPRMLISLYEIRNNRNVGHVGGDVNPNAMDATIVLYMTKWIVAELIRIFHSVDTETAEKHINGIIERTNPSIWKVDDIYRVLDNTLTMKEKALLILYHFNDKVEESNLVKWLEYSNASIFRRDIMRKAHSSRLIEYDSKRGTVIISPIGIKLVEEKILPKLN